MLRIPVGQAARRARDWTASAAVLVLAIASGAVAQTAPAAVRGPGFPADVVAPPLSVAAANRLAADPAALARLVAALPRQAADDSSGGASEGAGGPGTWQVVRLAPTSGLCNPLLLTDATVIVHVCDSPT